MSFSLLWLPLAIAVLDWIAVATRSKSLEYVTKPGVMVALLVWMWFTKPAVPDFGPWGWFALGVIASLAGDIFLMLPREQFTAGLVSFLLAHVAYIIVLNLDPVPITLPGVILTFMVSATVWRIYRRISTGLVTQGKQKLQRPVLLYSIVISLMLLSALNTLVQKTWEPVSALLVTGGGLFFFISDILLAWIRFVHPLSFGKLKFRVTYHIGQLALVVGVGFHLFD